MRTFVGAFLLLLAGMLAGSAGAASVSAASLGFDPGKFGLPIYPGATVKLGSAVAGKDFAGHSQRSATLETPDSVAAVAAWYASAWPGSVRKTYPGSARQLLVRAWGASSISISISRAGPATQIQLIVPGAY